MFQIGDTVQVYNWGGDFNSSVQGYFGKITGKTDSYWEVALEGHPDFSALYPLLCRDNEIIHDSTAKVLTKAISIDSLLDSFK